MKWLVFTFWKLFLWSPKLFFFIPAAFSCYLHCWYNNISKNNIILSRRSDPILEDVKQLFRGLDNNNTSTASYSPFLFVENWIPRKMFFFFFYQFLTTPAGLYIYIGSLMCVRTCMYGYMYTSRVCLPSIPQARSDRKLKSQFRVCLLLLPR